MKAWSKLTVDRIRCLLGAVLLFGFCTVPVALNAGPALTGPEGSGTLINEPGGSLGPLAAVQRPRLLFNTAWLNQWTRARAENHVWWQIVQRKADAEVAGTPDYADDGVFGAIAYQVTKDPKYAVGAYNTVFKQISADTMGLGLVNQFESQFLPFDAPAFVIVFDWIHSGLSSAQKATFMKELIGIGDLFLHGTVESGKDFWQYMRIPCQISWYIGDSDQVSYVYWTLALLDQALIGHSSRAGTFLTAQTKDVYGNIIGVGLDNTGTGGPAPASPQTVRDVIGDYARVASGGAWIEGCEYNRETLRPVLAAWMAMKQSMGEDHFPEYAKMVPDVGKFIFHEISPDLKMSYDWGDNEEPRTMSTPFTRELMVWGNTMMLASGANRGTLIQRQLNQLIDELSALYPSMTRPMSGLGLLGYYPYDPKTDWRKTLPRGYLAAGMGQFRYRTGWSDQDSYFGASMYTRTGADHEMGHFTDFQLYRKGEWVITSPQGYMTYPYEMHNGMGIGGEGSMWNRRPVANEFSAAYGYIAGTTRGTPDNPAAWIGSKRPYSFCREWTRSMFYLPTMKKTADSIVIYDRVDSPNTKEWVLHTPVQAHVAPGIATWNTTQTGQHVQLSILSPEAPTITTYPDKISGYLQPYEKNKFTLKAVPSVKQKWDKFLNVVNVYDSGSAPVVTKLSSSTGSAAEGVLLRRSGERDAVVLFSAVRGVRILSEGYTFSYTGKTSRANLYFLDLDPSIAWKAIVDGQPVSVTMNNKGIGTGVGSLTVQGAGAHNITVCPASCDFRIR